MGIRDYRTITVTSIAHSKSVAGATIGSFMGGALP